MIKKVNAFLCAVLTGLVAVAADTPSDMRLFLLVGQSNMAGRGKIEPSDKQTHPRIFMLDKDNAWVPAQDPVHFDKPKIAGVGLCSEFARCAAAKNPAAKIGLIPCAVGGTSLDEWKIGDALYTNTVARVRAALKSGTLQAILWHQGEADCAEKKRVSYPARFTSMIEQLRQDLNAEHVPVLVGELGRFEGKTGYLAFNDMLPQITNVVPRCALVPSEGLGANSDNIHFNAKALRAFGKRYFEQYEKLSPR